MDKYVKLAKQIALARLVPTAKYGDYAAWRKDVEHWAQMLGEDIYDFPPERI